MTDPAAQPETKTKPARPLRRLGVGINVLVQLITALALFLLVNYASNRHFLRRDLSPSQDYTISDQTGNFLRKLSKDVTITICFTRDSDIMRDVRAMAEQFRQVKKARITVREIDPARDLERTEQLKLENKITLSGNGILVGVKGNKPEENRTRFITEDEMIIQGLTGTRDRPSRDFRGEDALISAIISLIEGEAHRLYYITGKGSANARDLAPDLAALVDIGRRQNIEIADLNLAEVETVPADASGLVFLAPRYDLGDRELETLKAYWEGKRAALLVLLDPNADLPRLRGFLTANGIVPRLDRVLYAESTSAGPRKEFSVQGEFQDESPVSKPFVESSTRLAGQTQSLDLRGGTTEMTARHILITPLMNASERYWGETQYLDPLPIVDREDTKPPVHIVASVERGYVSDERLRVDSARMIVAGNATMLDPATRLAVDQDFISSCINWMINRERLIGVTPKHKQIFRLQLTEDQHQQIFRVTAIFLPGIALAFGFLIWSHRRA